MAGVSNIFELLVFRKLVQNWYLWFSTIPKLVVKLMDHAGTFQDCNKIPLTLLNGPTIISFGAQLSFS